MKTANKNQVLRSLQPFWVLFSPMPRSNVCRYLAFGFILFTFGKSFLQLFVSLVPRFL